MRIRNGEIDLDERGLPLTLSGDDLAFQKCEFLLKTPKGSFIFDKDFGSRIKGAKTLKRENREALIFEYAAEAVSKVPEVRVYEVKCGENDALITLKIGELSKEVSVSL